MPRFSIEENSSSSSENGDVRLPKRRRVPFPTRVLYRHGSSSNSPASVASILRREGTSTAAAAGTAGASASQPDSDDSFGESAGDSASEDAVDVDDDTDEEEEVSREAEAVAVAVTVTQRTAVTPRPATTVTPSPAVVQRPAVTPRPAATVTPSPAVVQRPAITFTSRDIALNLAIPVSKDVVPSGSGGRTSGRGPAVLTDTDVLDCTICFESYTIPIYQCDNGHTACASCCTKLRNKCPSCCSSIGYNRCRALEKVLEAVKINCLNSKYGCKEKVSYGMKREHEKSCAYEPCYCPLDGCGFDGSYKDVYLHFASKHSGSALRFKFDSSFPVHIGANSKYKFLQEHDHTLFVLNYGVQTIGNVANIICIGPSSLQNKYSYELEASNVDSSVKLTSLPQSQPKWTVGLPQKSVLVVPKCFFDSTVVHKIQVCIRRKVEK